LRAWLGPCPTAPQAGPYFDVHDLEDGHAFLRRLSHSAHQVTRWMELAEEWDEKQKTSDLEV
jgi:hypothetical protein